MKVLRSIVGGIRRIVSLVREGDSDMDGTYPDRGKPGPEDTATTTSVNIAGMGPGGIA
jgi:hypothetical protein